MATYKLTYFKVKALGEPIRFILSYGKVNWEDCRFETEQWLNVKPTTPFGKVPMLEVEGKKIHQSLAICRYLAKKFNLLGDNDWEALQIDMAVDTINDFRGICADYFRSKFYNEDEAVLAKKREPLITETIPYYFEKFEKIVKENDGYFVNGKLTWADLFWAAQSDSWCGSIGEDVLKNYPNLKALQQKVFALPSIKAWVDRRPKTDY